MRLATRSTLALLATAALGLGAAACSDSDDDGETSGGGATTATVEVADNFFDPEQVEISTGGTVTWEWVGNEPHNVVADDFQSELQQEGSFEHTFEDSGTFEYVCTVHPGMEGTVEVSG